MSLSENAAALAAGWLDTTTGYYAAAMGLRHNRGKGDLKMKKQRLQALDEFAPGVVYNHDDPQPYKGKARTGKPRTVLCAIKQLDDRALKIRYQTVVGPSDGLSRQEMRAGMLNAALTTNTCRPLPGDKYAVYLEDGYDFYVVVHKMAQRRLPRAERPT